LSYFFLDTSAIVKRYIVVAEITLVETAAAIAARHRAPGGSSLEERDEALALFLNHYVNEYEVTATERPILDRAVALTQTHRLRGYDAVQLATALAANDSLAEDELPNLTFVAADEDLVAAAQTEGLDADDPNRHP